MFHLAEFIAIFPDISFKALLIFSLNSFTNFFFKEATNVQSTYGIV